MLKWLASLEDGLFFGSIGRPPPWGPPLRLLRYPAALFRDWYAGEISVRAMSLAYTTLLSLVPLIAFGFAVLKGLGARANLEVIVHAFFRPMGGAADELTARVMQFVGNMRGDLVGAIGLFFLIYTVVTTIQKVEASFNFVWKIDRPRSLARRTGEYVGVMTLGPLLTTAALDVIASARSSPAARWAGAIPPLEWTLSIAGRALPYVIVTIAFTLMYVWIPNTRVGFRAALIGGVTAGVLWALVGKIFAAFILYSSQMLAVYAGFAVVLTTLIWVYVSWLILLIGAQLSFYVQQPQYLRHGQEQLELTGSAREQVGLSVMYLIGRDHGSGRGRWTAHRLAAELALPVTALAPVLTCLERGGLLRVADHDELLPGRDTRSIQLADVVDAVRMLQSGKLMVIVRATAPAVGIITQIEQAMRDRLAGQTLADLIGAP